MIVHISYSVDVSDNYRKAVARYWGNTGLATRQDIKEWHRMFGSSMDTDLNALDTRVNHEVP